MKKLILSICLIILCASLASAKSLGVRRQIQFYGGYTIDKAQPDTKPAAFDVSATEFRAVADILDIDFLKLVLQTTWL